MQLCSRALVGGILHNPSFTGETPPLMPSGGACPQPSSPDAVRSRDARLRVKLFKRRRSEANTAAYHAKKTAAASAIAVTAATLYGQLARPELYRSAAPPTVPNPIKKNTQPASTVPPPASAREMVLGQRHMYAARGCEWAPTTLSMTDSAGTENRTVFGVRYEHMAPMLWYLAPKLASAFAHMIAPRSVESRDLDADDACWAPRTRAEMQAWAASRVDREKGGLNDDGSYTNNNQKQLRGGSVICTENVWSSSGPHRDGTDTLLLVVSGRRTVWYAPTSKDDILDRDAVLTFTNGPPFLPSRLDPSLHATSEMEGVRWCSEPVTLEAGDAMWIRRGWWHCVRSEADSVAVPIEVHSDMVSGTTPCVWRKVAGVRQRGGGRRVLKDAPEWHSAARVRAMWEKTLEPR